MSEDNLDRMSKPNKRPLPKEWVDLIRGVRVEGETVVITVKGGNDAARCLCGELINEMEMRHE